VPGVCIWCTGFAMAPTHAAALVAQPGENTGGTLDGGSPRIPRRFEWYDPVPSGSDGAEASLFGDLNA